MQPFFLNFIQRSFRLPSGGRERGPPASVAAAVIQVPPSPSAGLFPSPGGDRSGSRHTAPSRYSPAATAFPACCPSPYPRSSGKFYCGGTKRRPGNRNTPPAQEYAARPSAAQWRGFLRINTHRPSRSGADRCCPYHCESDSPDNCTPPKCPFQRESAV